MKKIIVWLKSVVWKMLYFLSKQYLNNTSKIKKNMLILNFMLGWSVYSSLFLFFIAGWNFISCLTGMSSWADEISFRQKRVNSKSAFTCNRDKISSRDEKISVYTWLLSRDKTSRISYRDEIWFEKNLLKTYKNNYHFSLIC